VNRHAVTSADAFGGFLSALGVVLAIGSVLGGLLIGFSVHSAQVADLAEQAPASGSVAALGYVGAVGVGVVGVVVGMMMLWAGLVLRTLAVVAEGVEQRVGERRAVRPSVEPVPWSVPSAPLPRFGEAPTGA